jgi:hypothetical protein
MAGTGKMKGRGEREGGKVKKRDEGWQEKKKPKVKKKEKGG